MAEMAVRKTLKSRLLRNFIAVISITTLISCFIGTFLIDKWTMGQAQDRVSNSLNSAVEVLNHRLENIENAVEFASSSDAIRDALSKKNRLLLLGYLEGMRRTGGLDILDITDKNGEVLLRASNPSLFGGRIGNDDFVRNVLSSGTTGSSIEIVPYEEIRKEGEEIASRCVMSLTGKPKSEQSGEGPTTMPALVPPTTMPALVLVSASPILGDDGKAVGVLYGGEVLNRNDRFADRIRDILYRNERYRGKDLGLVTLFLKNIRISTNALNEDGTRAVGSAVSEDVARKVLAEGRRFVGKAQVLDDLYVTAYEPVRNLGNDIVGILAVGMLEQRFADMRTETLAIFLGITLFGVALSIFVANFLSGSVVRPINNLVHVSHRVSQGDFSVTVQPLSKNEIGELESTFNLMTSSLRDRDKEIKRLNEQHLMRSEKLASIGRLAAGIAHEINNPLTSVLTFSSLLLRKAEDSQREKLEIVIKEATRCRDIVRELLNFARQSEPRKEPCDINGIMDHALLLTRNQLKVGENYVTMKREFGDLPPLQVDPDQMLEIFINMIINAVDAMPQGGELTTVTSLLEDEKSIEIRITDTGHGIAEEDLEKVFEPFFTTKETGKGTGLGLAVTYGIVEAHNGSIDVKSEVGKGTTFIIKLPVE
jgi:two-component system, NtrC family, sensor kinase